MNTLKVASHHPFATGHEAGGGGGPRKMHPGFKAVAAKIGREKGIRNPGAVLAYATRNASKAAHKANPRLNRVRGK